MLSESERASLVAQMGPNPQNEVKDELPAPIAVLKDVLIRPYHPSDAEPSAAQANNPNVVKYMSDGFPHPYTLQDAYQWFELCAKEKPAMSFAIVDANTGAFMGGIGLKPQTDIHRRTVELGYWLGERYWGKGIMGQVVRGFVDWAFTARPHIARIEASIFDGNRGSQIVLQRQGFVEEGTHRKKAFKHGQLIDLRMYAVIREDWETAAGGKAQ